MQARLTILNGPNLDYLGIREPHLYGTVTLAAVERSCRALADALGLSLGFHQTNHEGVLVEQIHAARESADALIINPAGYSFSSVAVVDALKIVGKPIVELHITNQMTREPLRQHSLVSGVATAVIMGLGVYGYTAAMIAAARLIDALPATLPPALRTGPV